MTGNVSELCADSWHDTYEGAPTDGSAWIDPEMPVRVLRGGNFYFLEQSLPDHPKAQVSDRAVHPVGAQSYMGFRLAHSLP